MSIKNFSEYLSENNDSKQRLIDLGMAPNPLSITLADFKKMLKKEYREYIDSIKHQDDWMDMWEYYSNNARDYEREFGITRNDDGELEYTMDNTNWTDDDDDDYDY